MFARCDCTYPHGNESKVVIHSATVRMKSGPILFCENAKLRDLLGKGIGVVLISFLVFPHLPWISYQLHGTTSNVGLFRLESMLYIVSSVAGGKSFIARACEFFPLLSVRLPSAFTAFPSQSPAWPPPSLFPAQQVQTRARTGSSKRSLKLITFKFGSSCQHRNWVNTRIGILFTCS